MSKLLYIVAKMAKIRSQLIFKIVNFAEWKFLEIFDKVKLLKLPIAVSVINFKSTLGDVN